MAERSKVLKMETSLITYNLKDRGRKFRGKERNFHLKRLADSINGGSTQERVKNRDMIGYYGHWARLKFGLNPSEGNGQVVVEPAIVTTFLQANDDGTIQHKAEFLNTKAGQLAAQLFGSRTGGFSSAIDEKNHEFFGFDYVLEPNYSTNRGYELTLDSVTGNFSVKGMTLDDIMAAEYNDQLSGAMALIDNLNSVHSFTLDSLKRLQEENEELHSMIINQAKFDSVSMQPLSASKMPAQQIIEDIERFKTAQLPRLAVPNVENSQFNRLTNRLLHNGY